MNSASIKKEREDRWKNWFVTGKLYQRTGEYGGSVPYMFLEFVYRDMDSWLAMVFLNPWGEVDEWVALSHRNPSDVWERVL